MTRIPAAIISLATMFFSFQAHSSEIKDPWDWYVESKIPVVKKLDREGPIQLRITHRDLPTSMICEQPVLVFLGGYLPTTGFGAYQYLIESLVKRNITVIYPRYLSTNDEDQVADLIKGFNTKDLAQKVFDSIDPYMRTAYSTCVEDPKVVLYGHSLGARVAMSVAQLKTNNFVWAGLVLDGVAPNESEGTKLDETVLWSDKKGKSDVRISFPLSVIHYEADQVTKMYSTQAFENINATFKQLFEIKSLVSPDWKKIVQADHFSPMSGPLNVSALRSVALGSAKKIHGYDVSIVWNEVDQYSTLPLLTAFSWAAMSSLQTCDGVREEIWQKTNNANVSNCVFFEKVIQWSLLEAYGKNREMSFGGMTVRNVRSEGSYFPSAEPNLPKL